MNNMKTFISPPRSYLSSLEDCPMGTLPMGKWIWSRDYTRMFFRQDFLIQKCLKKVEAEFQSDGPIDFYVNGIIINTFKAEGRTFTGLQDITSLISKGTNKIGIRRFSSDNPLQFHVALRGCIRVYYQDGTLEDILTDETWRLYQMSRFWKSDEIENWMLADAPGRTHKVRVNDIHPRLLKHACLFRKAFTIHKSVRRAILSSSALGLYVPYLNGERVTEDRFIPGSMNQVTEYQVYDVTGYIRFGANMLAGETGNGFYNCESWGAMDENVPALMMELIVEYQDGSTDVIATDHTWQVQVSPRIENDLQYGERYDARREVPNWNLPEGMYNVQEAIPSFTEYAVPADSSHIKKLVRQSYPAVRIQKEEMADSMGVFSDGSVYYKFADNSSGRVKLCLKNTKAGERIIIRYCEILTEGEPYIETYGDVFYPEDTYYAGRAPYGVRNMDVYICKGAEEEVFIPEFTYTGFPYIYIKGYSGACTLDTVKKIEMNTNLTAAGEFHCSNEELNRISDAVRRSYLSNAVTGPTDCPTREKNFWNGDIQAFVSTACWYMDNKDFLSAWTKQGKKVQDDVYGWEDEEYILPLVLYRYYGDKKILEDKYPIAQRFIEKRKSWMKPGEKLPTNHAPYKDHQAIVNVSEDFFAACYYCFMYKDLAEIAEILDKTDEAEEYRQTFEELRGDFNDKYLLEEERDYNQRCQSGIVLPIAFGIAPDNMLESLAKRLHEYVVESKYHLTTGFMATEHVLNILCEYGYHDDAWKIMTNEEYPSLINMLRSSNCGTTTETWLGYDLQCGCSMNHYAIGGAAKYFFEELAGIHITEPGFKSVRLKPDFRKELKDCCAKYETPYGELKSEWHYQEDDDSFLWKVVVPEDMKCEYCVPEKVKVLISKEEKKGKLHDSK